jgi:hypothetical protein
MDPRTLVIVLHGFGNEPARFAHVKASVNDCVRGADVVIPKLPLGMLSRVDPVSIVTKLPAASE